MAKIQIKNEKTIILEEKINARVIFLFITPIELLLFIKYKIRKVRPPIAPSRNFLFKYFSHIHLYTSASHRDSELFDNHDRNPSATQKNGGCGFWVSNFLNDSTKHFFFSIRKHLVHAG